MAQDLTLRILEVVARLSGQEGSGLALAPSRNRVAMEAAYRQTLRRWWALTTQGPEADRAEVARTYQELLKLTDEVGEPAATRLRRAWAREWWEETGVCPYCGESGPFHDPAQ